jgi:hypothetical protein
MRFDDDVPGHPPAEDQDTIPPEASLYHEIVRLATRRPVSVIEFRVKLAGFRNPNAVNVFPFFLLSQERRSLGPSEGALGRTIERGGDGPGMASSRGFQIGVGSGKIEIGMRRTGAETFDCPPGSTPVRAGEGCLPTDGMLRPLKTRLPGNRDDGR